MSSPRFEKIGYRSSTLSHIGPDALPGAAEGSLDVVATVTRFCRTLQTYLSDHSGDTVAEFLSPPHRCIVSLGQLRFPGQ